MNANRIAAIALIYVVASVGWGFLSETTRRRSFDTASQLGSQVEGLWGKPLVQKAPSWGAQVPGTEEVRWLMPTQNDIRVELKADHRKKGLIWYPTYTCAFDGAYTITNTEDVAQKARVHFEFPAKGATYDGFSITLDGEPLSTPVDTNEGIREIVELAPGESKVLRITYGTRGIRDWRYVNDQNVGRVKNLNLSVDTDFRNVDYPDGALSPMTVETSDEGMTLTWKTTDLITSQAIGVVIPEKLNPGPLTSRITFFAPVCLLFFYILVAVINILYKVDIHPMHYLFIAAGFFAFHLLLSYMTGIVHIHVAFIISAVVAVTLVTSYLSAALKGQFPLKVAVGGQLFYLILFSYSFFLKGITGLVVAIGSVATLAVLMKVTAHVNWNEAFKMKKRIRKAPEVDSPQV